MHSVNESENMLIPYDDTEMRMNSPDVEVTPYELINWRLQAIEAAIARIETNSDMITELVKDFSTTISKLQLNPMLAKMFGLNKQPKE